MSKSHALHNESICDHLLPLNKYNDWVITTAFYSALHFVYHQIFPMTINGNSYACFDDYYQGEVAGKSVKISKHKSTIDLVAHNLNGCYAVYKQLHDMCMYSRYNHYKVTHHKAKIARTYLQSVKSLCSKP